MTESTIPTIPSPGNGGEYHETYDPERHVDLCFCCGRGLTERSKANGWWVHLSTSNVLFPVAIDDDIVPENEDQGWFPVGSECAKRIPAEYRQKGL